MIRQDFKHGDIIVATSHRNLLKAGINDLMWACKFDREITDIQEAVNLLYNQMTREYPGLRITIETIKDTIKPGDKHFLNTFGEVQSYENHELADVFDLRYLMGEDLDTLVKEKQNWEKNNNIQPDSDYCSRCYDGIEDIDTSKISVEPYEVELRRVGL